MPQVQAMLCHIEKKGSARTPDLAKAFELASEQVTQLLAPFVSSKVLVACTVIRYGKEMAEYRAMGGKIGHAASFRNFSILPPTDKVRMMERGHV